MIRVAMIGCGRMSGSYLREMERLSDQLQFTALVDVEIERARQAAQASRVADDARTATDYREVMEDVDAAVVAVPHHLHTRIAVDLIEAGKHVLIEKPLANTEQDCLEIVRAAERAGVVAMHGYVMRYNPLVRRFGRLLRERRYGECFQLSIWTEQYTDNSRGEWIGKVDQVGGGQLFSHGCHYIDLILHWMGQPESGTHLGTNMGTPWMEMEGTSNVVMNFRSGANAYHFGTWGARGTKLRYSFQAHCTGGMLELDYANGEIVLWLDPSHGDLGGMSREEMEDPENVPESRVLHRAGDSRKHTAAEMEHFLSCIREGREPETDLRSALQSLRAIWRLYDAEQQGVMADLGGLGPGQASLDPDPVLARRRRFGYTCDPQVLLEGVGDD
jgi:predicted dehydrogenase